MKPRNFAMLISGLFFVLAASAQIAVAQPFPSKPLHIIVPFPPGGAADITARLLGDHMAKGLGQPVLIENRPGAGAVIGYELGARSPADGHTLLVVFPSFIIHPSLRKVTFDPIRDFKAVSQTISVPMGIAVTPSLPIKSLEELIVYARANPGKLAYGTPGNGTTHHVVGEMLKLAVKIDIAHAPYPGEVPALTAVAGGHLSMALVNASAIAPFAKSGKARAIVVTSRERAEVLPETPTLREAGYPELESTNWAGMVVPAATPPAAIARLNAEVVRALDNAEIQSKLRAQGMTPAPGTPEQFMAMLQSESARYAKVVREAGMKSE